MKKIFITFLIVFTVTLCKGQWVSIPDTNFVSWLQSQYPSCMNGNLMDTTCSSIVNDFTIYLMGDTIADLTGIQYFDSLQFLHCQGNLLTSLPELPSHLVDFDCSSNQLISIPQIPATLKYFVCTNNHLSVLPLFPNNLLMLGCDHNLLSQLPLLGDSLLNLNCGYNLFTDLPQLPHHLLYLTCDSNLLTALPTLPDSLIGLSCVSNMGITCFPYLPLTLEQVFFGNTSISCIPDLPSVQFSLPLIYTLPICDIFNQYECDVYWNIKGNIFKDINGNCLYDSSDIHISGIPVQLFSGSNLKQTVFSFNGEYFFDVDTFGVYTIEIDTSAIPFYVNCPFGGNQIVITSAADSFETGIDLGLSCKPGFDLAAYGATRIHRFFPNAVTSILVFACDVVQGNYNIVCTPGISGLVKVTIDGPVQYFEPVQNALIPSVSGNVLTYTVNDFSLINLSDFYFNVITDSTASMDDSVCVETEIFSGIGDNNLSNNSNTTCFMISNSCDPNEKEVNPIGNLGYSFNDYLTYIIHFQNTGNAAAQHIQILDTLDSDLDVSTFQLLVYSHPNMTQVLEGGIVKFNFPNINLPDSTSNEPGSHGYIQYKIKPNSGVTPNTSFDNTASIYFDFNSPVVTNTTHTSFATGVQELQGESNLVLYPNPVTENVTVKFQNGIPINQIEIIDLLGRKVYDEKTTLNSTEIIGTSKIINLKSLSKGVYFIKVQSHHGEMLVKKIVKQ